MVVRSGRKQSDFRPASLPLDGTETVDLIKGGKNRRTALTSLLARALNRADHVGTQDIDTVDGLEDALAGKAPATGIAQSAVTDLVADLASKATPAQIDTAVAALVDSSPAVLDTLNELAAALGDDPNFATTITTALAGKQDSIPPGTYPETAAVVLKSLIDAKGDLIAGTGPDAVGRLPVGSAGQVLTPDATTSMGVKWAFASALGVQIDVDVEFGAVGDGKLSTGSMTAGGATPNRLTRGVASLTFTAADVGKKVMLKGAGPAGATLVSTITAFVNFSAVDLADAASTTVSQQLMAFGTDNTAALQAAYSSPSATYNTFNGRGATFLHPGNTYLCFGEITLTNVVNTCWQGRAGPAVSFAGGSDAAGSRVCYVGAGERFLTIDFANNIASLGMQWEYANPSFTGDLIHIAGNGTINPQTQSTWVYFGRSILQGQASAFNAGMLLNTGQSLPLLVDQCSFRYAGRAIHNGGDYPVIKGCVFQHFLRPPIINLRQVSVIRDCTFVGLMTSAGVAGQGGAGAYEKMTPTARSVSDAAITTSPGSPTGRRLSSPTLNATEADIGATVAITGAGASGTTLTTQITQVVSPTVVMIAQGARSTVSNTNVSLTSDGLASLTLDNVWCGDSITASGSWVKFRGASLVVRGSQLVASSARSIQIVGGAGAVNAVTVEGRSSLNSEGGLVGIDVTGTLYAPMLLLGVIFPTGGTAVTNEASVTEGITALGCTNYADRAPGLPGAPLFARSTANQVLTPSSTTLQDVTSVSLPVIANGVYEVVATIIYAATTAADVKVGWSGPASGTAFTWTALAPAVNVASTPAALVLSSLSLGQTSVLGATGDAVPMVVTLSGLLVVGTAAGTFKMQAAQNASEASTTTIYAGTRMRLVKVA